MIRPRRRFTGPEANIRGDQPARPGVPMRRTKRPGLVPFEQQIIGRPARFQAVRPLAVTMPFLKRIPSTTVRLFAASISATTTLAPLADNASAIARPIPLPAPVTIVALSCVVRSPAPPILLATFKSLRRPACRHTEPKIDGYYVATTVLRTPPRTSYRKRSSLSAQVMPAVFPLAASEPAAAGPLICLQPGNTALNPRIVSWHARLARRAHKWRSRFHSRRCIPDHPLSRRAVSSCPT